MNLKKQYIPHQEKVYEVSEDLSRSSRSILLLEDDNSTVEVLTQHLEREGFRVIAAKDGMQGLKQVMANDFDVVICDMMMPNLPGDMFHTAVSKTKPHMAKRFIFITGYVSDDKVKTFIQRIKGLILYKPFEMPALFENINLILQKNAQQ